MFGLTNTQVPLWAHNLFGSAFCIFLLRQFFLAGADRDFIFEFRASWTDLMWPLIYLRDGSLFTLPRGLKVILDQFGQGGESQWEVVLAASVIATVPMLVIFFRGQRYFVEGIATTGRRARAQNWTSASPVTWSNTKLTKKKPKNRKLSTRPR